MTLPNLELMTHQARPRPSSNTQSARMLEIAFMYCTCLHHPCSSLAATGLGGGLLVWGAVVCVGGVFGQMVLGGGERPSHSQFYHRIFSGKNSAISPS